ncbi:SDR family NAD(P)-dependent oxidoreductase [Apibacter raozihei]|uniref:SDR family NAD(P)-dependent oxidoreductase n=1 Tax=Apibacter raozihei TaxID=2500547 RepID=UPI000FE353EF|nr:SDR family NAD(P)-dependent oxidoreductase [Apibacter raozihei]
MNKFNFCEYFLYPPLNLNREKLEQKLSGKTLLITGASYGIGKSLCYLLAGMSVHLVITARSTDKLLILKSEIEKQGTKVSVFSCNLYNTLECENLINFLKNISGGIDIFISNAGKSIRRPLNQSLERFHDYQRTMNLNYFAPVQLCLYLIPVLKKNKGHIISVSAVNVLLEPAPYWAAYQASKTAFDQWLRSNIPELKTMDITTSIIYLPLVKTRMIVPTPIYKNFPARKPIDAAIIIAKAIISKQNSYKPWWLFICQFASLTASKWFRIICTFYVKKNEKNRNSL